MRIVVNFVIMLLILHTYAAFSQPEPGVIEDDSTATIESTSEAIITGWERTKEFWSDSSITARIINRFLRDEKISIFIIKVSTQNSVTTLSGELESKELAQRAMDITIATEGVIEVINDLYIVTRKKSTAR
ncbi:MAG TPA: BON domain-containing protein [Nitrospinota bacterium]|nr:BON domain-containing protein [Nitrospinota bacterium]|tara:strand:+ start:69371 stop:69763 length:393 start_codon:yes stop_codon:yes gene_type:complete